jgi:hypothetical protein
MQLPTIVFLDIDKTIIGRANAAVERYFLHKVIHEVIDAGELPSSARPSPALSPEAEMGPLIRPGFAQAMRHLRGTLPNLELFVCTMGTPSTVSELKVPGIERATGVRFNRPLFHRTLCQSVTVEDRKLVGSCFRQAIAALSKRKKYAGLDRPSVAARVFREHFFMVDDTANVAFDDASNARLVVCPPYEFMPAPAGLLTGVPPVALRSPKVASYAAARGLHRGRKDDGDHDDGDHDTFWATLAAASTPGKGVAGILAALR